MVTRAKIEGAEGIYLLQPQAVAPQLFRVAVDLNGAQKGLGGRNISPNVALKLATGAPLSVPFYTTLGTPSYDYPPTPKVKAYTERMNAFAPNLGVTAGFSFYFYDFVFMLTEAMTKAGTVDDTTRIAQTLGSITYEGVAGRVCFGKDPRTAHYDGGQIFVRDGKVESKAFPSDCP